MFDLATRNMKNVFKEEILVVQPVVLTSNVTLCDFHSISANSQALIKQ